MVECEYNSFMDIPEGVDVLIDTWWNVNDEARDLLLILPYVLIDTWWNVNYKNRRLCTGGRHVLIDTWWNVNGEMATTERTDFPF